MGRNPTEASAEEKNQLETSTVLTQPQAWGLHRSLPVAQLRKKIPCLVLQQKTDIGRTQYDQQL